MPNVQVLLGTRKGAFIMESDAARKDWSLRGPYLPGRIIMHMAFDPRTGILYAATGDPWFGSRIYRSRDHGHTWDEPATGPAFPEDSGKNMEKVWHVEPAGPDQPRVVYAGVEPAALFKSTDDGESWSWMPPLNQHPTAEKWVPGAGGLCLHTIVIDPHDRDRVTVAISAAGVFQTADGGATWNPANNGTRVNFMPDEPPTYAEWGQCVHKVVQHPSTPDRLYQQNHCGVYRSDDKGANWTEITEGLPSDWGFPIAVHPHDPDTIYTCPGISGYQHWAPGASLAVFRSRDRGNTWSRLSNGLPQQDAYVISLREGMAMDKLETPGIYLGTNTGQVYYSPDAGENWREAPGVLPPILSVGAVTL